MALHEKCNECYLFEQGTCSGTRDTSSLNSLVDKCAETIIRIGENFRLTAIQNNLPVNASAIQSLSDELVYRLNVASGISSKYHKLLENIPHLYNDWIRDMERVGCSPMLRRKLLMQEIRTSLAKACGEEE